MNHTTIEGASQTIIIDPEFSGLIPPISDDEYSLLEENIIQDGCRDPLVLWQGILLDGHNRYKICTEHSILYSTTLLSLESREDAADWIDKNQLGRRNLTPDQMSLLRGRRYNRVKGKQGGTGANQYVQTGQNVQSATTAETLAQEHHVNERTIRRDGRFADAVGKIKKVDPNIEQRVVTGTAPAKQDIIQAAKLLDEYPEEAIDIIKGDKKIKPVMRKIRRDERKEKLKQPNMPTGKYRVIYADPPWKYSDELNEIPYGSAEKYYPTMAIDELCDMEIEDMCEDNAVLFLWTTSPLLEDAFKVIKAWGFSYKASFVWDKIKHNYGHYNSVRHEFLLLCTRGSCLPDNNKLYDSVVECERTKKHSEKPEIFREIIDSLYAAGNKIELFSRNTPPSHWTAWGNECINA